jgi:hypothetical protein
VAKVLARAREPFDGPRSLLTMNHEKSGFDCPGCAWPDATNGLHLDLCENGIKHATWEMTPKRVDRNFFDAHTVAELSGWDDFSLEDQGRLTEPMPYNCRHAVRRCSAVLRRRPASLSSHREGHPRATRWSISRCPGSGKFSVGLDGHGRTDVTRGRRTVRLRRLPHGGPCATEADR